MLYVYTTDVWKDCAWVQFDLFLTFSPSLTTISKMKLSLSLSLLSYYLFPSWWVGGGRGGNELNFLRALQVRDKKYYNNK